MYIIIGATGNVGSKIAETLLASGQKVRVLARNADRLKLLSEKGAEAVSGSVEDAAFLTRVFEDATAVFGMIPTDVTVKSIAANQDSIGEAISSALAVTKVSHVVNLSSLGAEHESGTGPIAGLHRQEKRLNELEKSHVLHLRPTYFMENFLTTIPMIKSMGIIGSSIRPDLSLPLVAARDIAAVAADSLLKPNFPERSIRPLLGPRDYTFTEATRILGQAIGKPELPYVPFSEADWEQGMIAAGISPDVARSYVEMERAINNGLAAAYHRDEQSKTPTTIEDFATIFAAAYKET